MSPSRYQRSLEAPPSTKLPDHLGLHSLTSPGTFRVLPFFGEAFQCFQPSVRTSELCEQSEGPEPADGQASQAICRVEPADSAAEEGESEPRLI